MRSSPPHGRGGGGGATAGVPTRRRDTARAAEGRGAAPRGVAATKAIGATQLLLLWRGAMLEW